MFESNIPEVCLDHSRSDLGHSDGGVDEVQTDGLCESIDRKLGGVVEGSTGIGVDALRGETQKQSGQRVSH